jgi:hypothetical protein
MKYNAVLKRKNQFGILASVLELEIPDHIKEKEDYAAPWLVAEYGIYVELEPIKPERKHRLAK